jgi:ParB family chromosome partitioning protein
VSEPTLKKRGLPLRVKMRHEPHFVEELAARHEAPVGRMLPLSVIEPDPSQPRTAVGDLDDLVASIRAKGVLEPLLVRRSPGSASAPAASDTDPTVYQIISGERRYRAAVAAGLFEVPVIEMDVSDEEALEITLIENLQRKDLTAFEEADGFAALADRHGYTHEQVAEAVGRSRSAVTESLSLLQVPSRVRDTAQALGVTSKSVLLEVAKAGAEHEMLQMLERISTQGLTRDDLRQRGKKGKAGGSRRKPFVFKFRAPDRTYSLALSFRQSEVDRGDLIRALESILTELRGAADHD